MHIHRTRSSILLRESYREGSAVKKRTLKNITDWSAERIAALEAVLKGDVRSRKFTNISDVELGTGSVWQIKLGPRGSRKWGHPAGSMVVAAHI